MIFDIYSKRHKELSKTDVFIYNDLPAPFRAQVVHIIKDAFHYADYQGFKVANNLYKIIAGIICREYGYLYLPIGTVIHTDDNFEQQLVAFFINADYTAALDVIELSFRFIERVLPETYGLKPAISAKDAVDELNARFKEHSLGFQYEDGIIIKMDSTLIHAEVVRPALLLLSDSMYAGASSEFLTAHEHYRHGRYKECLNDCLKAFESTMKAICDKRGWARDPNATASRLIEVCFNNELIPNFMQSQIAGLRSGLESGVPTVRNRLAGHGQGTQPVTVPSYIASYMLHLTATTILLLGEAEKALT